MPTRYLTVVVKDGCNTIAQYGHFDGYPSAKGKEILEVLKKDTTQRITTQLHRCIPLTEAEYRSFFTNYFLNEEVLTEAHPDFFWGDGADLLKQMYETDKRFTVHLEYDFAYDSLQCEWAYVVDYDKQVFEIYKGWNRKSLAPEERFYYNGYKKDGFYPVRMIAQYSMDALPELEEMEDERWMG